MAVQRDRPYERSNFLVDLGTGDPHDARAMFLRVDLPHATVDEIAYRSGSARTNEEQKEPGLASYTHLVLTRGLIGSTDLWDWWKLARQGDKNVDRNIVVSLLDEERNEVWRWHFRNAFPVGYHTTALDTLSADPVAEVVTLTFDSMEID
jgi:phage tail-like protein